MACHGCRLAEPESTAGTRRSVCRHRLRKLCDDAAQERVDAISEDEGKGKLAEDATKLSKKVSIFSELVKKMID
jgi:hypothetical protein